MSLSLFLCYKNPQRGQVCCGSSGQGGWRAAGESRTAAELVPKSMTGKARHAVQQQEVLHGASAALRMERVAGVQANGQHSVQSALAPSAGTVLTEANPNGEISPEQSAAGVLAGALLPPAGWEQRCCVTCMVHPCNWQVATCNVERKRSTAQTWRLMSYHLPARPSPCSAGER